jgi:hypothetical protein
MKLNFEERLSDSPFVERIWRTQSRSGGSFISLALSHWQMCVWERNGKTNVTLRGPETKATRVECPADTEFFGIIFKLGTVMAPLPASTLVDADLNLPDANSQSFWLNGSSWQFPNYENADTFIDRLVREGLLVQETVVATALQDQPQPLSSRSVERRFLQVTGITQGAIRQIERARYATTLLQQGVPILDVVDLAGYTDQSYLTNSLKRFIGQTPAQLTRQNNDEQLSMLFKTMYSE